VTPDKTQPAAPPAGPGQPPAAPSPADTGFVVSGATPNAPGPAGGGAAASRPGGTLGKYRITDVLGHGGMGMVVKARDPMIERDVAIKVLPGPLAADPTALGRFLDEARAIGKLSHPNVVVLHEIGEDGPTLFLVMEYVPGGSLEGGGPDQSALPVLEATRALIDACKGVGAAHAAGLIHRDLKPANLMRAADGSVKVADFGLAKAAASTRHFTQTGMAMGTPFFMSPEQCAAKPLDHRSDLYSLGASYYTLLTGRHAYEETESATQIMYLHCHGPVPDPRAINPAIPEACSRIVARAMAKSPAERYQSAAEMLADLQALAATLSGQTPISLPGDSRAVAAKPAGPETPPPSPQKGGGQGRRIAAAVAGLSLLALIGLAVVAWRPWQKPPAAGPAAPAGEPVKVGVLHSLSGTMADSEAPVVDAVLFALDEVNQAGGVLGRPVKPVVADGRSDWPTFEREAERLLIEEKVRTVFGCWTSASRKTVRPAFEEYDNLLMYPVQFEGLETSPNVVYLGPAPNQQILPALEWAMTEQKKKRFFLVGSDYVFPRAANQIIRDRLKRAGAQVVGEEYVPLGSPKVEAVVAAVARAKPDMILNTINGDTNVAFFRALRGAGITSADTPTLSFSIGEQGLRGLNPTHLEGDYAAGTYFESVDTPENADFVRRFHEKYPQRRITDPMETAYVGVKLWAAAVNECQSLSPRAIRRALLSERLQGPGGEVRLDSDTQYCYRTPRIGRFQADGRFRAVWTAPGPVRPEPYPDSRTADAWRAYLHDLYTGWGKRWAAPETD
jgi:urea transport system substrate-binding protein